VIGVAVSHFLPAALGRKDGHNAIRGSKPIISTTDKLFTVRLMQPMRPTLVRGGVDKCGEQLNGRRGSAIESRACRFASGTAPEHSVAPCKLYHLILARSQNYSFGSERWLGDSRLLTYFFSIAAMKPSARNPSTRVISM
jgi:hypothetical protein